LRTMMDAEILKDLENRGVSDVVRR